MTIENSIVGPRWLPVRSPPEHCRVRSPRAAGHFAYNYFGARPAVRRQRPEHPGRYAAARLRLGPETAAAGAGVRHAQMARAILRGYELDEPDATHAVRMLGSVFHGYVSLELAGGFERSAPGAQELGRGFA
ncbi:TetR-like C-terminal domain-containing protein [Micromonospora sp. NPDC005206]|uniref:TetR-like C-terminal domain-containing protein n=1 Tax=Micromonospora sp. NPDC005206 TaxID=3157022 RepID=UPI0033BE1DEC